MNRHSGDGFLGLEFTSNSWLKNHFVAKAPQRVKQIAELPIKPGDFVLDVCCGPGHYAEQFALMTGPLGHVFAVDKDPTHIDDAERRKTMSIFNELITYDTHDMASGTAPSIIEDIPINVITFFNSLFYFSEKLSLLKTLFNLLDSNGHLIIKDSDFGNFFVSPFETDLQHRIIQAAELDNSTSFDNFAGRHLFSVAQTLPNAAITSKVWPYVAHAPLSEPMRHYVSVNLMTLLDQARPNLKKADVHRWTQLYDTNRDDSHINTDSFFFTMSEIVVIATKR